MIEKIKKLINFPRLDYLTDHYASDHTIKKYNDLLKTKYSLDLFIYYFGWIGIPIIFLFLFNIYKSITEPSFFVIIFSMMQFFILSEFIKSICSFLRFSKKFTKLNEYTQEDFIHFKIIGPELTKSTEESNLSIISRNNHALIKDMIHYKSSILYSYLISFNLQFLFFIKIFDLVLP